MANNRVYMDACCIIEAAKGRLGKPLTHGAEEADYAQRVIRAGREGLLDVYTSTLSVAECLHVGEKPPPDDVKELFESLLLSGRDGITPVEPTPFVVERARDLAWDRHIWGRSVDLVHLASAIEIGAEELLTVDGRLAEKIGVQEIDGCRIIPARMTNLLPMKYRMGDLLHGLDEKDEPDTG